ncbi:hypothetical protein BGZ95_004828, partial [Linnemannia exigua]
GGFDSTPHLLEHIVEDIKQTKEDIQDGLGHLKDSVLSGIPKSSANTRESVKEARFTSSSSSPPPAPSTERRSWWSSGSSSSSSSHDHSHAHHGHGHESQGHAHHLADHIREDIRQTKEDIQHGVEHLKDAVFGAETAAHNKAQEVKSQVEKTAKDTQGWWSYRTQDVLADEVGKVDAERKMRGLESEVHSGLNKAGERLREMGQEATVDSDAEFWQKRAQQERRESGRAL